MKYLVFLLLALLCLNSCDIFNKDEDAVAFVRISDFPLSVEPGEGSASENIKDVWLSVNGELIGGFEIPVDIPVLSEGPANIKAFAGILDNGISTIRERYPFYEIYDVNVDLFDEQVIEIFPATTYIQNALQFTIEDFEEPGIKMIRSLTSDTTINPVVNPDLTDSLRDGNVGQINLEGQKNHFKVESTFFLDLAFLSLVYMELDYRCEAPFVVGLKRSEPSTSYISVAGFNPVFDSNGDGIGGGSCMDLAKAIRLMNSDTPPKIAVLLGFLGKLERKLR